MIVDAEAEGATWAIEGDSRITKVGKIIRKLRIDEIPQLWNVLKGDLSLIGPRPERPEFVSTLEKEIPYYSVRHSVKPGITGWAQVNYRYGASKKDTFEKLQYDLYYIKNKSLLLDIVILIKTVKVVLLGSGAR
jgi:lipopolysaccharide/colanic/teichoic acid biosynthesis glycosyltransferase